MTSNIQVLIHMGELQQIVEIIKRARGGPVGGCLFGLWRNSLKQPVIQFVTGPGQRSSLGTERFTPDGNYNGNCLGIMKNDHAMLQLGYWYSGSPNDYGNVLGELGKPRYNLLLFISSDTHFLSGDFYLKKDDEENEGRLYREDILPGDSSFRLYISLARKIMQEAKFTFGPDDCQDISKLTEKLPSRTKVSDPETKKEQWYSNDEGVEILQSMFQFLQSKNFKVEMSRDANTHNLQFTLNDTDCIDFPRDFPRDKPVLSSLHDQTQPRCLNVNPESIEKICESLLYALRPSFNQY